MYDGRGFGTSVSERPKKRLTTGVYAQNVEMIRESVHVPI